ncbi:MAG: tRNA (adenosine(37)-N6)-dimethylallyltransferase MiaA [Oscillospiraceae bacterium]|nr:tRNA (adenosine(37)-N6)-dimethylallyltransferase MiaA [Oscillospiraceae bacterium]
MKKLLVIAGPTASGKTALGIALARRLNGEIVSADSMQIYRGMDIGTAKANAWEQAQVPHHLLDILNPGENYSVSRYVEDATLVCEDLFRAGKQPVVVGGTGLYIDSLLLGRCFAGAPAEDTALRGRLGADYDREGGEAMLRRLQAVDPARAQKLSPTDRRRIIRALEIHTLTGRSMTEHDEESRKQPPAYDALYVVLCFSERAKLYERIERRVDRMCEEGLFEETQKLLTAGVPDESTCMQAIGYRQAAMALRGELSREEAVAQIKQATRRYAKRQMTWFRRHEEALFLEAEGHTAEELAETVCQRFAAAEGETDD